MLSPEQADNLRVVAEALVTMNVYLETIAVKLQKIDLVTMNVYLETIAVKLQKIKTVLQETKGIPDNRLK